MPFSVSTKLKAFRRSGGRCECRRGNHRHVGRCHAKITSSTVQFHHVHAVSQGGHDGLSNCEALCKTCHELTPSYGR